MINTGRDETLIETEPTKYARVDPAHSRHASRVDAIGCYLAEVGRHPILTIEEERQLTKSIRSARVSFRYAMLEDVRVMTEVAASLVGVGRGEHRVDRLMEVAVTDHDRKQALQRIAEVNGLTLQGMLSAWSKARFHRALVLVDETKLKTSEIERIWRGIPNRDDAATMQLAKYERLRNKMVSANLRLAISVARKYQNRGLPLQDLIQEASRGLFRAIDKFDPERGLKFSTYAVWWAKQHVRCALSEQSRLMKLNAAAMQRVREVQYAATKLRQQGERIVRLEDVAHLMGVPRKELIAYWNARNVPTSLDKEFAPGSEETFAETLVDQRSHDLQSKLVREDDRKIIRKALRNLDSREKQVIRLRFGLTDGIHRNLAEVGRRMSLTRERIRQIEKSSLQKLRRSMTDPEA